MKIETLILSEERKYRLRRHFLFWFIWWFYYALLHAANPFGSPEMSYFRNPVFTFVESALMMLAQMPLVYIMLYLILPRLILKKQYSKAVLATFILWVLGGLWHYYLLVFSLPKVMAFLLPARFLEHTQRPPSASFFMALMGAYKGAFTITAVGFVFKFAKNWYLKEQRNLQLQKEKSDAQLQLLTAQIHPHFLFNTLNNIFSQTQTESPKGSGMIMGLSDMLRYILYEGAKPLVPLKQELDMIREYINLEKIRYGNALDVHLRIPSHIDDLHIAPLLLLPFFENCFKHGTSKILQHPWINCTIELHDNKMVMKLMNGKAPRSKEEIRGSGIGVQNVKQRLELLYKNKYELSITEDEEVFVVDLQVELVRINGKLQTLPSNQAELENAS